MPLTTPSRGHLPSVQLIGDGRKAAEALLTKLVDQRSDIRRSGILLRVQRLTGLLPGIVDMRITQNDPTRLSLLEGLTGAGRDHFPLLFSKGGIDMEHEGIDPQPQFSDDEGHTLGHQAADEMDVSRQSIQLADQNGRLMLPRHRHRSQQSGPTIHRIAALACLDFDFLPNDRDIIVVGEFVGARSLGFEAKA